jgi:arylsulfatase A-like enzyme
MAHGQDAPSFFMFLHFKNPDTTGHVAGDGSRQYREAIMAADKRLYLLMEMVRQYGWNDTGILVTTDHGFDGVWHSRPSGRIVFNTWIAGYNVPLSAAGIPLRTEADYCASQEDPADCLANGPEVPMPPEDAVPNVHVTSVLPTILDMYGVEWRGDPLVAGQSLYQP